MKIAHRPAPKAAAPSAIAKTESKTEAKTKAPETAFTTPVRHQTVQKPDGQAPAANVKMDAQIGGKPFDGWLKVHDVSVKISRGGISETQDLKLLQRPGHDSTHVETLRLHGDGPPTIVYKEGDTRPAAALRGTPYVSTGIVAGSLDHEGVDAEATALMEIAEEVGGQPLGKLVRLGDAMPTMPVTDGSGDIASSESDNYYLGVLSDVQGEIKGDGGGLEVVGLMKPVDVSIADALKKIDSGGIRENARARVALSRGLDKMGFVPQLNMWLKDLPPALQQRFDNLGLGETYDPRTATTPAALPHEEPEAPGKPAPVLQNMQLASKIDDVDLGSPRAVDVGNGATLLDGKVNHLADDGTGKKVPVGRPMPVQTLHADYDRLKLAQFYVDPKLGPMVKLELAERPILAAKAKLTGKAEQAVRQDVTDVKVPLPHVDIAGGKAVGAKDIEKQAAQAALAIAKGLVPGASVEVLSAPSYASPGQADLQYHFLAASVPPGGSGFVPLAEALRRCRSAGAGDANTEALLSRLADKLQWIPQLGMTVEQAQRQLV